jgi:hypothetical protein
MKNISTGTGLCVLGLCVALLPGAALGAASPWRFCVLNSVAYQIGDVSIEQTPPYTPWWYSANIGSQRAEVAAMSSIIWSNEGYLGDFNGISMQWYSDTGNAAIFPRGQIHITTSAYLEYVRQGGVEWSLGESKDALADGTILPPGTYEFRFVKPPTNSNYFSASLGLRYLESNQPPTCLSADLFADNQINGADLGILLSQWGPATVSTVSDINRDGKVDGADLGYLLANWGPCPN